ncbi:MAG: HU family DNA-binding protein, partial [Bacteroidaceae bacterium]|nr:HU family DNA-binding protein [Bacteroidaceae bacterium]
MGEKISVQDIAEVLAKAEGLQKNEAQAFVRVFFETVFKGLGQDKYVKIKGLGTFKTVEVENRESINVNTGERFTIGGHAKISFTTDNNLKELINKPFAHFETVMLNEDVTDDDLEMINHKFEDAKHEKDVLSQNLSSQSVSIQNEQDSTLYPFDDQEQNNNIPEVTEKHEVLANSKEHLESNNQSSPEQLQFDSPRASNIVSDVEQTKVPSKRSFRNWVWAMLCFIAMLLGYV